MKVCQTVTGEIFTIFSAFRCLSVYVSGTEKKKQVFVLINKRKYEASLQVRTRYRKQFLRNKRKI